MISSWNEFFIAVEQMRECQKAYLRTKIPAVLHASKKCEASVDAFIEKRCAELARPIQPELIGENHE